MYFLKLNTSHVNHIKNIFQSSTRINSINSRVSQQGKIYGHQLCAHYSTNDNNQKTSCSNYSTAAQTSTKTNENSSGLPHAFYRHCDKATTEPVQGEVKGEIPKWLDGVMIRNGAGIMKVGDEKYKHLFDGMSVLHRYRISNGTATYMSRPLESDTYKKNMQANRIVVSEFGTAATKDPCKSIFQRLQSKFQIMKGSTDSIMTDNCNVNVAFYGDQLYAMTETNLVRKISPDSLNTEGEKTRISDYVAVNHASAHPHILEDGSVLNVGNNYRHKNGPHYCVIKVPPKFNSNETSFQDTKLIAEFPFSSKRYPCYYHSFGCTQDKVIFIESPLRLDLVSLVKSSVLGTTYASSIKWDPEAKVRFHVASLDGKVSPVIYEADGFFTFHHINAYEEDGQIIVDVAGYNNGDIVTSMEGDQVYNRQQSIGAGATARRYILPTNISKDVKPGENLVTIKNSQATASLVPPTEKTKQDGKEEKIRIHCTPQHLSKFWMELPRINYKYNGKKYNFLYGLSSESGLWSTPEPENITKVDISKNEFLQWSEAGLVPSEPIFVANPNSASEDDGVILSALLHENVEKAVTLLILNAKDMKELARVKFNTEGTFTSTFHGLYAQNGEKIHRY